MPGVDLSAVSFVTDSVDEAARRLRSSFRVERFRPLDVRAPFRLTFHAVEVGDIVVGRRACTVPIELGGAARGSCTVVLPLQGLLRLRQHGSAVTGSSAAAVVVHPGAAFEIAEWSAGATVGLALHPDTLRNHLEQLIAAPVPARVPLTRVLDASAGPGASLKRLLVRAAQDLADPEGLWNSPLMLPLLRESLLTGLLISCEHPWRDLMDRPRHAMFPPHLRRAVEALHDCPEQPWTAGRLATSAGVSTRALQEAFRSHLDTTYTAYLRDVRLQRVRAELESADPGAATVRSIAQRWGFVHQPRFAQYYRNRYGEHPHQTMQRV